MSPVTAARIGSSPITLDWSGFSAASNGQSFTPSAIDLAWSRLRSRFESREIGYHDAPAENGLSQATECVALAEKIRGAGRIQDVFWLGIGGSALGPLSLLSSLEERASGGPRFHFLQNTDPQEWLAASRRANPESTLVVCVTKSGTTFETLAQFLLALDWLGRERWTSQVVAVTDPEKGDLRKFAEAEKIPTLAIAPSIGGRFSVFTPVGLFAAALSGLSVSDLLKGATQVRDYVNRQPAEKNQIFLLGAELLKNLSKRPITVCMPYSTRLQLMGDWFVQLWGESLGKDGKGFTPVAALGATDQHSILQLLRDGPDDKVTGFVTVDQVEDRVKIPKPLLESQSAGLPAFRILENHSLKDLLDIEYQATSLVLSRRSRPHFTLRLDRLDEQALGALYFVYATLTAFTGSLAELNPFDQPGVEEAKVYIRESLQKVSEDSSRNEENERAVERLRRHRDTDRDPDRESD